MKIQKPKIVDGAKRPKGQKIGFWKIIFRIFTGEFASLSILEVLVIIAIVGGGVYYIKNVFQVSYENRLAEKAVGLEKCQLESQKEAERNAYDKVRISDTTNVLLALQDYSFNTGDLPPDLLQLRTEKYLDGNLNDPELGRPYYFKKLSPSDYVLCIYLTTGVWGTNTSQCPTKDEFLSGDYKAVEIISSSTATSTDLLSAGTSSQSVKKLVISSTPTGTLNIRASSSLSAKIISKAIPGEEYEVLGETEGWANIKLNKIVKQDNEEYASGWVSKEYVEILK